MKRLKKVLLLMLSVTVGTVMLSSCSAPREPIFFKWEEGELIDTGIGGGYPRLYTLADGTMLLGYDGMYVAKSSDDGSTWGEAVHASQDYAGTANANFFQTEDGTIYLGFRSTGHRDDGSFYSSIQISSSTDNAQTWQHHSTVYENVEESGVFKGVWEPHLGMMNGRLTCFYANDSTSITAYQNIEYKQWNEETGVWTDRTIVCNGGEHQSRDGMPVWLQASTGEYVCVIEAFDKDNEDRFAIKLTYSEDGRTWSEPVTVMRPKAFGSVCAAPGIIELPTGQFMVSCQTNELVNGEDCFNMSTVISDGAPVKELTEASFGEHDYPYYDSDAAIYTSMWNGMHINDSYIYTSSITGHKGIRINRYNISDMTE